VIKIRYTPLKLSNSSPTDIAPEDRPKFPRRKSHVTNHQFSGSILVFTGFSCPVPRDFEVNSPTPEEFNSSPPCKVTQIPKGKPISSSLTTLLQGRAIELHRCILLVYIQGYIIDMIDGFNRPILPETNVAPENTRKSLFETTIF